MRKLTLGILLATVGWSGVAAAGQAPVLSLSEPMAAGAYWGVTLTNNYSAAVTAYAVEMGTPGVNARGHRIAWRDAVSSEADLHLGLGPGQTVFLRLGKGVPPVPAQIHNTAVIYADGTTAGSAPMVQHFLRTRQQFLSELPGAIQILRGAGSDPGTSASLLSAEFQRRRATAEAAMNDGVLHESDGVSGSVIATLQNHPGQNVQATASAIARRFTLWQAKLAASLPRLSAATAAPQR